MLHNNVLFVFLVAYCLCSIGDYSVVASKEPLRAHIIGGNENFQGPNDISELDCSQFSNDHDVLRQFPFHVQLIRTIYEHGKSTALMSEDGTFVEEITIMEENFVPLILFCLSNLTSLNLEFTRFENDIVPDALANLKTLKSLNIQFTPIQKMTEQLATLTNLESIMCVKCSLTHLPDIGNLHKLKLLYLPLNNLSQIDELSNTDLLVLDLAVNNFTEIPILKNKENLRFLSLTDNPLKNAEPIISYPNLQHMFLNNAMLTSVPAAIDKLQELQQLRIDGNQLTNLPASIFNLPKLESLDVSRNLFSPDNIESIKEAFRKHRPTTRLTI